MVNSHGPRVLQVVADGKAGGGTTFVLGLSEYLRDCGHQVSLITEPGSYAAQQASHLGFDVRHFDFFKWPRSESSHRVLCAALADVSAELVHFHGPRAALPGMLGLAGHLPRPQRVYTVHGYHFKKKSTLPRVAGYLAERVVQYFAHAVVHVSAADARFAQQNHFASIERSHVILNGVADSIHRTVLLNERRFDVVFAARFVRQKNPVFAARVLRLLAEAGYKVALVGDGELRSEVQLALGRSSVTQFGALSHHATTAILADSKILLLPSLWEGLPLTPMETMIGGGVVVASNIDGNNEVVKHGETGMLIDSYDLETYVNQIQVLLKDNEHMQVMGNFARSIARQQFTNQRCFEEYRALYQNLLRTPS